MTRNRTYLLTAVSAGLFAALCWIFADGMFTNSFWNSETIASSTLWTYTHVPADSTADRQEAVIRQPLVVVHVARKQEVRS